MDQKSFNHYLRPSGLFFNPLFMKTKVIAMLQAGHSVGFIALCLNLSLSYIYKIRADLRP
jgi:uncharacterized membrane protein (DUF485 family)